MSEHSSAKTLNIKGQDVVYRYHKPRKAGGKTVVFLHGLGSDSHGSKITALEPYCHQIGLGTLAFDYPCHGQSDGKLVDFTVSKALDTVFALLDTLDEQVILYGSSTGGWLTLLTAINQPKKVAGAITIACATDFTEELYWQSMTPAQQTDWIEKGYLESPADDGEIWHIGYELITDGRKHLLFGTGILQKLTCPIRFIHGMDDDVVPFGFSVRTASECGSENAQTILVKGANHSLSRPQDIAIQKHHLRTFADE